MMASRGFSGAVKLTGLDDFITPSLECIKPVDSSKTPSSEPSVRIWKNGTSESNENAPPQKATISLTDCLACAGCVTTAESVLVEAQSSEELRKRFKSKGTLYDVIVVSVSTQSIVSLAHKFNLSLLKASQGIIKYFKDLGADYVYNLKPCEDIALQEQSLEVLSHLSEGGKKGPIISSSCPGWICYAEKTHGEWILPYVSRVKSPQQIMGSLIKSWAANRLSAAPNRICHVSVMPCFDKKLEASRRDFMDSESNVPDVDLVTTSIELEQMLESDNFSLNVAPGDLPVFDTILKESASTELQVNHGSGSGGFCETVFLDTIKSLFNDTDPSLNYKVLRNADFMELKYEKEGRKLRFGVANGFRNIQNIVQMLKRKKCDFDYIEIMACPSGCLNGGAQASHESDLGGNKDLLQALKGLYESLPRKHSSETQLPKDLYAELKPLFYTQYHAVPKETNGLNIQW